MKHSDILAAASAAACSAWWNAGGSDRDADTFRPRVESVLADLYGYARARSFPKDEVLARKAAELLGEASPAAALWGDQGGPERMFWRAFGAIIESFEPMHEDDPAGYQEQLAARYEKMQAEADQFAEMAIKGAYYVNEHDCLETLRGEGWLVTPKKKRK